MKSKKVCKGVILLKARADSSFRKKNIHYFYLQRKEEDECQTWTTVVKKFWIT